MSQPVGFRFINTNSSVTQKVGVGLSSIVGPSGPQGWQGTIGYQGFQGISGFSTNTGAQGWQGSQGQVGPQGIIGQGFRIFATVSTFNDLCSTNPTGSNIGEFVLITGGELYVYAGTGFGTTGPSG